MFQIKSCNLDDLYTLCHVQIVLLVNLFENIDKVRFEFHTNQNEIRPTTFNCNTRSDRHDLAI
jgi:hypothetical protein